MKKVLALILALVLCLSLVACGESKSDNKADDTAKADTAAPAADDKAATDDAAAPVEDASAVSARPETITFGCTTLGRFLDAASPMANSSACDCVYDAVFIINKDKSITSNILEEWHYEDDLTFKMTLKPGVTFTNGDEAKAEDLLYSFQQHFIRNSAFTKWIGPLDPDASYTEGDYTVVLKYTEPYGPGPWANTIYLFDKSWCEAETFDSEKWYNEPNGSGPYKVLEYINDDHFTIVPKDNWWMGDAQAEFAVKEWIYKYYPDSSTLSMALEVGDVDLAGIGVADYDRFNELMADPDSGIGVIAVSAGTNMIFTMAGDQNPILNDIHVREALAKGVDWAAVGASVMGSLYKPATSCFISDSPYYTNVGAYEFDQEAAKAALAAGGYKEGDITIKYLCMTGSEYQQLSTSAQYYMDQLGINFDIQYGDMNDVFTKWTQDGYSDVLFMTYGQGSVAAEPHHALAHFYSRSNVGAYCADEYFRNLGLEALHSVDQTKRAELYAQFQQEVKDNYMIIPVYENMCCLAYDATIFTAAEMEQYVLHPLFLQTRALSK